MSSSAEYITEWPPPPGINTPEGGGGREEEEVVSLKRPRLEGSDPCEGSSPLVASPPSIKTQTLLAQWWKRSGPKGTSLAGGEGGTSSNPNTKLFRISRLSEAREFLRQRINYLSTLRDGPESHDANISMATCYHLLGPELQYTLPALAHAESAKNTAAGREERDEVLWFLELLRRQSVAEEGKERGRKLMKNWPPEKLKMPKYAQVERRAQSELSCVEFQECYARTHTPVIITGGSTTGGKPWTLDYIAETIGHRVAPLKRVVSGSLEWARLEEAGEDKVASFIASLDSQADGDAKYLFDWSLPLHCPELMEDLKIPEYFSENVFLRTPKSSLYHDSWPSLFIAPAGIASELHVDAFCSNFWMVLFEGKKRWVFFPPEDLPFLYPTYFNSMDATFEADLSRGDAGLASHPLLALTHPRECVLGPGEILFVPYGSPHRVQNLTKSLAISANFVDASNIEAVREELRVNGLLDPRADSLLRVLDEEEVKYASTS